MIKVFLNDDLLAKHLALQILKQLKRKKKLILGCPGGRSLKKTYFYIGRLSAKLNISLNSLTIVMMDEYVDKMIYNKKLPEVLSSYPTDPA